MTLHIRAGEPADVAVIAQLIRDLAHYEKLEHEVTMTEEKLTDSLFGERRYAETLIAEDSGEPVGFALFFHNFSTFLAQPGIYLEDLFVVPARRGQGIGQALLKALARTAAERGCGRLEWAVLDWNATAIGFYERQGAAVLPDWRICRMTGDALARLATRP